MDDYFKYSEVYGEGNEVESWSRNNGDGWSPRCFKSLEYLSTTIGRLIEPFTRPLNEREKESAQRGHHEPAEPRKRKKEGRKGTSQKQNNLRIFNGSNISNISSVSNRYSGYIGNQMLFGWVTQVALSLGIHLAVARGSRTTLPFLGPSLVSGALGAST